MSVPGSYVGLANEAPLVQEILNQYGKSIVAYALTGAYGHGSFSLEVQWSDVDEADSAIAA
jgi:hypothetical protein